MTIDTNNLVSITEANQNFSKVARLVDEKSAAVILKNVPRYILMEFPEAENMQAAAGEDVEAVSKRLMAKYAEAYKELAK